MDWLIYGANGYTGQLIAAEATRRGHRPILAGRDGVAVEKLARSLGLASRTFGLAEPAALRAGLDGCGLVLHCAGPFVLTSAPMLQACLDLGAHYLDITGEIDVFEAAWQRSAEATRADIVVCPGTGFDVVPSDCLLASLVRKLPASVSLVMAFEASGGLSPGTAQTSLRRLASGGCVRKEGRLTPVPLAWKTREFPFSAGSRTAVSIPWGDVFTAWVSTGVPDVEVYLSMPPATIARLRRLRRVQPALRWAWVQRLIARRIRNRVRGPDAETRASTGVEVWAEAGSADGRKLSGRMFGPNGYVITVNAALGIVEHLLGNRPEGGYYTPALLMGPEFAATLPGIRMEIGEIEPGSVG